MSVTQLFKPRLGRRLLLTPELQEKICKAIAVGALYKSAAQANGISYNTFLEWMARGRGIGSRGKSKIFADFASAVEQAEGQARALTEGKLRTENPLQYLARRYPEDWGASSDVEGTSVNVTVNIEQRAEKLRILRAMTPEQRDRLEELQREMSELIRSVNVQQSERIGPREIETTATTLNGTGKVD